MQTPALLLGPMLLLAVAGCSDSYTFAASATPNPDGTVSVSWSGDPARELTVFRCAAACPDPDALPTYSEDANPSIEGATLVWRIHGITGVEAGRGSISPPVVVGEAPPEATELVPPDALPLAPGSYLVRVVQSEGNLFSATWGTAWAAFELPR